MNLSRTLTLHRLDRRSALLGALLLVLPVLLLLPVGAAHAAADDSGTPPGKAWVRAGHFVPGFGATSIDLTPLDGTSTTMPIVMSRGATYGEVSAYQKLAPGSYRVTVRESNAAGSSAPMLSRSFEVKAGQARTIAVLGTSARPRLAVLTDDLTPPKAGSARVRLLSASAVAKDVSVMALNGPTIASDAVLGETTGYTTVPDGSWTLSLKGSSNMSTQETVDLASGSVYTAVALDSPDGDVTLKLLTDAAGAVVTPKGGADTGLGGTAPQARGQAHSGVSVLVLAAVTGLGLLVGARRLRRTAGPDTR